MLHSFTVLFECFFGDILALKPIWLGLCFHGNYYTQVDSKLPSRSITVNGIGLSHARPNSGISGDLLSENEAKPVVICCSGGGCYSLVHTVINFAVVNWWRGFQLVEDASWLLRTKTLAIYRTSQSTTIVNTQNISLLLYSSIGLYSYAAVHKQKVPVIHNHITNSLMLYVGRLCVYITSALLKTFPSLKPVFLIF